MSLASKQDSIQQLKCLVEIREIVGDPQGKMMQPELVDHIRRKFAEFERLRVAVSRMRHCQREFNATKASDVGKAAKYAARAVDRLLVFGSEGEK